MSNFHGLKASLSSVASAGIWAPIATSLPEHVPLIAISGFFGGLARWIALKERLWPDGLGTLVTGMTVAVFLWPVGQPFLEPAIGKLEMDPVTAMMFGGFVTGLMGVSMIGWLLDIVRAKRGGQNAGSDN